VTSLVFSISPPPTWIVLESIQDIRVLIYKYIRVSQQSVLTFPVVLQILIVFELQTKASTLLSLGVPLTLS
jgi:hypothetical protein